MNCTHCGCDQLVLLGSLGPNTVLRCRNCGWEILAPDDGDSPYDASDDDSLNPIPMPPSQRRR